MNLLDIMNNVNLQVYIIPQSSIGLETNGYWMGKYIDCIVAVPHRQKALLETMYWSFEIKHF